MGKIAVDSLEPGMVLASDVHDRTGRLLLGAGIELTPKHLVIFRTWGVEAADIEGVDEYAALSPLPPEISEETLRETEASLAPLFEASNPEHPVMRELIRLAALRKIQHGAA
jgi:hypothetical protein